MNSLDSMLERNKDFAAQQSAAGTLMPWLPQALPHVKAIGDRTVPITRAPNIEADVELI
jgi:hypothetical protein